MPNELSPTTFGQIEALKAQAVAARTYIQRNLGQYRNEGYDICATDACQVYFGAGTEDPLATQAVVETRGVVATYDGKPINALYSSTCGGRTEDAENIFDEKVPYLVSTICEYKHPEPLPFAIVTVRRRIGRTACSPSRGVSTFGDAARFMGLPDRGEPPSDGAGGSGGLHPADVLPVADTASDLSFVTEQGLLPPAGRCPPRSCSSGSSTRRARSNGSRASWSPWTGRRCGSW